MIRTSINPAMHGRRLAFRPPALANGNSRPQHKKSKQNDEVSLSVKLFRQIHPDFSHGCQRLVTGFALSSLLLGRKLWLTMNPPLQNGQLLEEPLLAP